MLKTLTSLAFLVAAHAAHAVLVFDNFDPFASTGTFVGADDWQGGDRMVLPVAGAGSLWTLNSFTGHMGGSATGTYTGIVATLTVYRAVVTSGTGPAFADPFGSISRNLPSFFASGPGVGTDFTMSGLGIVLHSPPTDPSVGYGIKIAFTASGPGVVVPHYRDMASSVPGSSSSQGWYRDLNDGLIGADEYQVFAPWANGNLMFELDATATAVPEPGALSMLAVPFLLSVRRRRK
jgi:hypothetical protein